MNTAQNYINRANKMREKLSKSLFGQDRAIDAIASSIKSNLVSNKDAPKFTYLFLGAPATGKSYLAELMTQNIEGYQIRNFDMTQYHEQNGGELYGYPKGWSGYDVGQLTGFVHDNPKSIIVLDGFEKADNVIQNNLLSIFDGGQMRDACGWDKMTDMPCSDDAEKVYNDGNANYVVDFRDTIFIITSSLGKELYSDSKFIQLVDDDYIQAETMILDALKREEKPNIKTGGEQKAIIPELISRFSQATIVLFNKLNYLAYEEIGKQAFMTYKQAFGRQMKINFLMDKNFEYFLKTQILIFAPEFDARRIKNKIGELFFSKITDHIIESNTDILVYKDIKISFSKIAIDFIKENVLPLIKEEKLVKELFRKNIKLEVNDSITLKGDTVMYKIKSCEFKQVKRIKDFSEDGLVFDIPDVSFSDIAGHNKAKSRLLEVIKFLKTPKMLEAFAVQPPKGMLLYGPPGTGKTLLAKAFSAEAELPFISITGVEMLQLDKIKKVFDKAKEYAPAIIFIDEIDSIGKRGKDNSREVQINKFLAQMDGFSNKIDENIFIIAATNYKENIDPAIIRAGRIEIHIPIDDLDKDAREYFINKILKEKPTTGDFDMKKLLIYTAGLTGAELELISKESSFHCIRENIPAINQDILIEQINIIKYGEKHSQIQHEKMYHKTAIREASHAVISKVLMPHIAIKQIALVTSKKDKGFIKKNNDDDLGQNMTIEDIKNRICVSLAGRLAQIKHYGDIEGVDVDASSDLQQAMHDAYTAIAHYGMDEEVKYIKLPQAKEEKEKKHSQNHEKIEKAIERWMHECEAKTQTLVHTHWDKIEALSSTLLEKEIMYAKDLEEV